MPRIKTKKFKVGIKETDYQVLRKSSTFVHKFERDPDTKVVMFSTKQPKQLFTDLDKLDILPLPAEQALELQVRTRRR